MRTSLAGLRFARRERDNAEMSEPRRRTPQNARLHWATIVICGAIGVGVGLWLLLAGR